MSEIVRYCLDNLRALSGFHILLILLLAGLLTGVLTKILVTLFEQRISARDDLLRLKEGLVAELKARASEKEEAITNIEKELARTRDKAEAAQTEAHSRATHATDLEKAVEALAETGLAFQTTYYNSLKIYFLQRLLDQTRSMTAIYFEIAVIARDELEAANGLRRRTDQVSKMFKPLDREITTFPLPVIGQFRKGVEPPEQVVHFPYREVEDRLNAIVEEARAGISRLGRAILEKIKS